MIDPKTYWNSRKAKVAEPEPHLRQLSVAVSKERLPGGCILYRLDWDAHISPNQWQEQL